MLYCKKCWVSVSPSETNCCPGCDTRCQDIRAHYAVEALEDAITAIKAIPTEIIGKWGQLTTIEAIYAVIASLRAIE